MASPEEEYSNFLHAMGEEIRLAMLTYKNGVFKKKISTTKTAIEVFELLISTPLTTPTEKKVFQLGRCLTFPFIKSPSLEEVRRRIKLYFSAVIGAFTNDSAKFKAPPFYCFVDDETIGFSVTVNDQGNLVYVEGENMEAYFCVDLIKHVPSFNDSAIPQESTNFKEIEATTKPEDNKFVPKLAIVHPSTVLTFPNIIDPYFEDDNYQFAIDLIRKELLMEVKLYKKEAFKNKVNDTMPISTIFDILIGSPLITPAERDIFRTALQWIEYITTRFSSLSILTRFHSMLYCGVFIEKVFGVFRNVEDAAMERKDSSLPTVPYWNLQQINSGINDQIVVGDDWNIIRIPYAESTPPSGYTHQRISLTSGLNSHCSFESFGNSAFMQGEKMSGMDTDTKSFQKIVESRLAKNPTRERTRDGNLNAEKFCESGLGLYRWLGRTPTVDELLLDVVGSMRPKIYEGDTTVREREMLD